MQGQDTPVLMVIKDSDGQVSCKFNRNIQESFYCNISNVEVRDVAVYSNQLLLCFVSPGVWGVGIWAF